MAVEASRCESASEAPTSTSIQEAFSGASSVPSLTLSAYETSEYLNSCALYVDV